MKLPATDRCLALLSLFFSAALIGCFASPASATTPPAQVVTNTGSQEPLTSIDAAVRATWKSYEALVANGEIQGKTVALFPPYFLAKDGKSFVGGNGEQVARRLRELAPKGIVCIVEEGLRRRLDVNLLGTSAYTNVDDLSFLAGELQVAYAIGGEIRSVENRNVIHNAGVEVRLVGTQAHAIAFAHDKTVVPNCDKNDGLTGGRIRDFHNEAFKPARIGWGADPKATRPSTDTVARGVYLNTIVEQAVADFVEANRESLAPDASGLPLGIAPSLQRTADGDKNTALSAWIEKALARPELKLGSVVDPSRLVNNAEGAATQLRFFVDEDPAPSVLRALKVRGIVFADYDHQDLVQRLSLKLRFVGMRESFTYSIELSTQRSADVLAQALRQPGTVRNAAANVDAELMLIGALERTAVQLLDDHAEQLVGQQVRVAPVLTPATGVWESVLDWYRNALLNERERVLSAALAAWKGAKEPEQALADPAFPVQLATGQKYSCWTEAQMAVLFEANCAFSSTKEQSAATKWKNDVERKLLEAMPNTKLGRAEADLGQLARLAGDMHAGGGAKPTSWRDVQPGYLIQLKVVPRGATFIDVTATLIDWRKPFANQEVATRTERLPKAVNAGIASLLEKSSFPEKALLARFLGRNFTAEELESLKK
jgi:hypothetical protein